MEYRESRQWSFKVDNVLSLEYHWLARVRNYEILYHLVMERIGRKIVKTKTCLDQNDKG